MARTIVFYVNTDATLPNVPVNAEVYRVCNDHDVDMALLANLHEDIAQILFVGGLDAAELAKVNAAPYTKYVPS